MRIEQACANAYVFSHKRECAAAGNYGEYNQARVHAQTSRKSIVRVWPP